MNRYYKTPRTSETGAKLQSLMEIAQQIEIETKQLQDKYGFVNSYSSDYYAFGGIAAVVFSDDQEIDLRLWKRTPSVGYNAYSPRSGNKDGKKIKAEFDAIPRIPRHDFDEIIGIQQVFQNAGLHLDHPEFFLFCIDSRWKCKIPSDCERISDIEYEQLQNQE